MAFWTKITGSAGNALIGLLGGECTDEALHLFAPDIALPALGLHIDDIEPETVFVDHTVDACFGGFLGDLSSFLARTTVAHSVNHPQWSHRFD
jgi:hypothetical protein